ncbi:MAG: hypothetical protein RLZZ628_4487 [Bacteroidota bacterium]|jgi:hypothetical protein
MNKNQQILVILVTLYLSVFSSGCQKDKIQIIPEDLLVYVQTFFEEGNKRGANITLKNINLEIRFSVLMGKNATCTFNKTKHLIEIDSVNWKKRSIYDKEWLVYHELGHCVLGRDHLLKTLPKGECQSVMSNSEGLNCSINFKSESWRKYYFDELFNHLLFIPNWYQDTLLSLNDTIQILQGSYINFKQDSFVSNINLIDERKNFALEVGFYNSVQSSRNLCLLLDDKMLNFVAIPNFNVAEIKNTKKYIYGGTSNLAVSENIILKIIKKGAYYIFAINNQVIHVMDYEPIQDSLFQIRCFSTESNFNYKFYYFK